LSLRRTGTVIGLIFFALLFLIYFLSFGDRDLTPLKVLTYETLFILVFIHIVSILFHTLAAWLLLIGIHRGSRFSQVYLILTASLGIGYLLPGKLGLPARVYLYHRLFHLQVGAAFGLVGWELAVTTLIPLLFSVSGLWIFYRHDLFFFSVVFLIFLIPSFLLIVYLVSRDVAGNRWLFKFGRFFSSLVPFAEGLRQCLRLLSVWRLLFFSLFCGLVLLCSVWFCQVLLWYFGKPVSFFTLLSIQSLSYLAGMISLMPMGLGARELGLAALLGEVGVPADIAIYAALIQRLIATGITFPLSLISWQILGLKGNLFPRKEV